MALIIPKGKLVVGLPQYDGLVTEFGLARDWRCNERWVGYNCEYIEPLRAIAPVGDIYPADMATADWTASWNNRWRERYVSGFPVAQWLEFYDGSIYAAGTASSTSAGNLLSDGDWSPRWALFLQRYTPPSTQGVYSWFAIQQEALWWNGATWADAIFSIFLPLGDDTYGKPFMHLAYPATHATTFDVLTEGTVLSTYDGGFEREQGPQRLTLTLEYEEDTAKYSGGYVLALFAGATKRWAYHNRNLRLSTGQVRVTCNGGIQSFCLAPITYQRNGTTMPWQEKPMPVVSGETWVSATTWDTVQSTATDWVVSVAKEGSSQRPVVSFTRDAYGQTAKRPVLWMANEQHDATIANADATTETTEGEAKLQSLTWRWDRTYRGCRGVATFSGFESEPFPNWRENAKVDVYLGWQTGAGASITSALVASGYIVPGTLTKLRDGGAFAGDPQLGSVEIGAFDVVRMARKDILDLRQAGGMMVNDFMLMAGNRMGLPTSMIDVAVAVQTLEIPLAELPSAPAFAPQDSDSWAQLFDQIQEACDIRIGFGKDTTGKFFADAGPPTYSHGYSSIAFSIDEDTVTPEDVVYRIEHNRSGDGFRNFVKIIVGPDDDRAEYYWAEALADREAGIGDDWSRVIVDDDTDRSSGIYDVASKFFSTECVWQDDIVWVGPARRDLMPDEFVQITHCDDLGFEVDAVYQITSHEIEVDIEAFDARSTIRAVQVYPVLSGEY